MSSRASVIRVEPDLAETFNTAPEHEQERVKNAMRTLLRIVPPTPDKAQRLSRKETGLFLKINRNLSEEKQKQYDELTERRLDGTLTRKERKELGELIKEVQQIWIARLRAVNDLARLRRVSPEEMFKQLELDPRVIPS